MMKRCSCQQRHGIHRSSLQGIDTLHFSIDPYALQNSSVNPANAPYYMNTTGLFDTSRCEGGIPVLCLQPCPAVQRLLIIPSRLLLALAVFRLAFLCRTIWTAMSG